MILVRRHPSATYTVKLNTNGEIEDVTVEATPVGKKRPRKNSRRKAGLPQRLSMLPAFMGVI